MNKQAKGIWESIKKVGWQSFKFFLKKALLIVAKGLAMKTYHALTDDKKVKSSLRTAGVNPAMLSQMFHDALKMVKAPDEVIQEMAQVIQLPAIQEKFEYYNPEEQKPEDLVNSMILALEKAMQEQKKTTLESSYRAEIIRRAKLK